MPGFYRASNKRLIARGGNGRFRRTTLSDLGMACCQQCGAIWSPDLSGTVTAGGFIDLSRQTRRSVPA